MNEKKSESVVREIKRSGMVENQMAPNSPPDIFIARLVTPEYTQSIKMLLLK